MNNCDNCNNCDDIDGCETPKIKFELTDEAIEVIKEKADAAGLEFNAMVKQILIENMLENKSHFGFDGVNDTELKDYLEKSVHIDVIVEAGEEEAGCCGHCKTETKTEEEPKSKPE